MASIGKFTTSALSASQELTIALANLNFDFSLVKIDAPLQFHALGASLSSSRRDIAENGKSHVTARKLGALFEGLVPATPQLVAAYGTRASEIAGSSLSDLNDKSIEGIFSDFTGADGTSIWAAATSGSGAISVHLLACMLARIWNAAEATSIWVEIVETRKRELMESANTGIITLPTLLAAQVVVERNQLAEWDNSARAWLRQADQAKRKEQTQLMLILNNLSIPVNGKIGTYESVVHALKSALTAMEGLLLGRPQSVQDGSLLLALSCWHIYPDLLVLGSQKISQNDPLVPTGGMITLGVESSPSQGSTGVYWSLNLAHMRYYGKPVAVQRSIETASGRVTMDQLLQVALGSVIAGWGYKGIDIVESAGVITSIYNNILSTTSRASGLPLSGVDRAVIANKRVLDAEWRRNFQEGPNWIRMLADSVHTVTNAKAVDRKIYQKLIALGHGRASSFVIEKGSQPPAIFGLSEFRPFISLLDNEEDRIAILRKYAQRFFPDANPWEVIIRYRPDRRGARQGAYPREVSSPTQNSEPPSSKEATESQQDNGKGIANPDIVDSKYQSQQVKTNITELGKGGKSEKVIPTIEIESRGANQAEEAVPISQTYEYATALPMTDTSSEAGRQSALHYVRWVDSRLPRPSCFSKTFGLECLTEVVEKVTYDMVEMDLEYEEARKSSGTEGVLKGGKLIPRLDPNSTSKSSEVKFEYFIGDPESAAIYVQPKIRQDWQKIENLSFWVTKKAQRKKIVDMVDVKQALDSGAISAQALELFLRDQSKQNYYLSLRALSSIQVLYNFFPNATIDTSVTLKPLYAANWLKGHFANQYALSARCLSRERAFACIAMFESGSLDLAASSCTNVFALSSGDSLYVTASLLRDPGLQPASHEIHRLIGNIGKPGLVLLVPPADPQVSELKSDSWRMIDRKPYDGQLCDSFTNTSLTLSFTDWIYPVDAGVVGQGNRDVEAHLMESLISVHNKGAWIADLDILKALKRGCSQFDHKYYYNPKCHHNETDLAHTCTGEEMEMNMASITSIDSWEEFLDRPQGPAVVRAYKNWLARLATAILSVERGDRVLVGEGICWYCYKDLEEVGGSSIVDKITFIS